jgi:ribosome maturation factor RimP
MCCGPGREPRGQAVFDASILDRGLSVVRGRVPRLEVGFAAHLFFGATAQLMQTDSLTIDIEQRLASAEPEVELVAVEKAGRERLRVVIDRPQGVDLDTCERVTGHLRDLLVDFGLEVSSPGPERPLTKPDHFRRFLGRRARVRLREPRDGHRSVSGELVGASGDEVTLAAAEGLVSIPYSDISRSNLLPEAAGSPRKRLEGEG